MLSLVVLCLALPAQGLSLEGRLQPSAALPISSPQQELFRLGPQLFGATGLALTGWLDLELQVGAVVLPPRTSQISSPGTSFFAGLGPRLRWKNAHWAPWLDLGAHYNFTGGLSRVSFTLALGVGFRFHPESTFWVGPVIRYLRVMKLRELPDGINGDASLLSFGLAVELDPTVHFAPPDADADGFADAVDTCPNVAGVAPNGCPVTLEDDPDGDGIRGAADLCPHEPEDFDGFKDDDGCPDLDNDNDGVPDALDACPLVPGKKENRGCPLYAQVVVTESHLELNQVIHFAFGTHEILPRSFSMLDEVVKALDDRPQICVRIEGHTDSVGNDPQNRALSETRATAVLTYLTLHAIKPARLEAKGYGSSLPLERNDTVEGRGANRRVEFVIQPCAK